MRIREPVVEGQFYPAGANDCRKAIEELLAALPEPEDSAARFVGGIVPHAGWVYSGRAAARVFRVLATGRTPTSVVLFGGAHRGRSADAAIFADGRWDTPLGSIDVDARLADRIQGQSNLFRDDPFAHEAEHSIEVQLPMVRHLLPEAKIVPIIVPPGPHSVEVGEAIGRTLTTYEYDALVVGTTDLTHYGPSYGFMPKGIGAKGNAWAKNENDRRMIELICALRGDEIVVEALGHQNACSSGAVAATIGAVRVLGAERGELLEHTVSSEVMPGNAPGDVADSVGYAGLVFS